MREVWGPQNTTSSLNRSPWAPGAICLRHSLHRPGSSAVFLQGLRCVLHAYLFTWVTDLCAPCRTGLLSRHLPVASTAPHRIVPQIFASQSTMKRERRPNCVYPSITEHPLNSPLYPISHSRPPTLNFLKYSIRTMCVVLPPMTST